MNETLYLRKSRKDIEKDKRKSGETVSVLKNNRPHIKKVLDDNLESYNVNTVSHTLRSQIQKSRMSQNLTQKQLAQKINVTQNVIQSYENGKAIPDNKVLQQLRRVLKVKLVV